MVLGARADLAAIGLPVQLRLGVERIAVRAALPSGKRFFSAEPVQRASNGLRYQEAGEQRHSAGRKPQIS
ncbi:hypothetical protein DK26_13780 [Bosea sp. WAO]|nr:hypothetical protein DK26_13780 [Bosea sp. WAO]